MNPQMLLTGHKITSSARELWIEQDFVGAIEFLNGCVEMSERAAIEVCIGRSKLEGNSYSGYKLVADYSNNWCGVKLLGIVEAFRSATASVTWMGSASHD